MQNAEPRGIGAWLGERVGG